MEYDACPAPTPVARKLRAEMVDWDAVWVAEPSPDRLEAAVQSLQGPVAPATMVLSLSPSLI